MQLSIIIPVYKEHIRLNDTFIRLLAFMARTVNTDLDVIFIDDGSPDDSAVILTKLIEKSGQTNIRLIRYPINKGKGYAVKTGVMAADGDIILMSDADFSTPLDDWRKLFESLTSGADIVCGSRAIHGAHIGKKAPLLRRILSWVFNRLVRLAGVHGIRDTQCGFKLFRTQPARVIFNQLKTNRFAFDVEMIAVARDLGYRVDEVAVNWDYSEHSTVRIFSSGGRMLFDLCAIAFRRLVKYILKKI